MANTRLLLKKAAYTTADLSVGVNRMNRAQADAFIDMTTNEGTILQSENSRVLRVNNPLGRFVRMKFGEPVTRGATENTEFIYTVKPTFTYQDYSTVKLATAMDWSTELEEENNEGASHIDTVMDALATKVAEDLELLAIFGDTAAYAAVNTATGFLLRNYNGWFKQAAAANIVDTGGSAISKVVFSEMIRAMPNIYKQNRSRLRFYASPSIVQDLRDQFASRQTLMGDNAITGNTPLQIYGVPIVEVPLFSETMNRYDGSEVYGDGTFLWLTDPRNLVFILSRDWETFSEFKPRKDATEYTMYSKSSAIIENTEAMVMAVNVRVQAAS